MAAILEFLGFLGLCISGPNKQKPHTPLREQRLQTSYCFQPAPVENRTIQTKYDKFSGLKVYAVGPLLVSSKEKTDEPLFTWHSTFIIPKETQAVPRNNSIEHKLRDCQNACDG